MHFLVTVAVLVYTPPSGGARERGAEATAAVVAAERARGVDVIEDPMALVYAGWVEEKKLAFFAQGAQLVSDGRRALARVELEKAEALLAQAERVYMAGANRPGATTELAEAAKWHGVALFELKRRDEAMYAWRRAKRFDPASELTEAMVRPEVAQAFATVTVPEQKPIVLPDTAVRQYFSNPNYFPEGEVRSVEDALDVDATLVVALAVDAGALTYVATLRSKGCGTETLTSTRAQDLVKRLHEAPCRENAPIAIMDAPVILHPRPAPSLAKGHAGPERPTPVWRKPWLWVGVVGAIGVGVVLAASLWPRDPSYTATADFHSFALGAR